MKKILFLYLTISLIPSILKSQSVELDKQLGISSAQQIATDMGIYMLPDSSEYVNEIGNRLLLKVKQPFNFKFNIVDSSIPNAFALPGGYVYVSRGLLALSNSEDELAGVLGHEISHVLERHSVQHLKKSILPALLQVPGNLLGKIDEGFGQLFNAPLSLSSQLYLASYSRGQEYEADDVGTKLAANTGYDPNALAVILQNLGLASEIYTGEKEERSYFDDHPITSKRVDRIYKISAKTTVRAFPKIAESTLDYYKEIEGIIYGDNPKRGIFLNNVFIHPIYKFSFEFPSGWETYNTSSWVGAYDEKENSMIYMTLLDSIQSPATYSNKIIDEIKKEGGLSPVENNKITFNGFEGNYLAYHVNIDEEIYLMSFVWVKYNQHVYQIAGFGLLSSQELINKSIYSFQVPGSDLLNSIEVKVIRIRKAKEGESIPEFNTRTGNIWNTSYTAIANNLTKESKLTEGQVLKIILNEPFIIQ